MDPGIPSSGLVSDKKALSWCLASVLALGYSQLLSGLEYAPMELLVWLRCALRITLESWDLGGGRNIKARSVSLQDLTSSVAINNPRLLILRD